MSEQQISAKELQQHQTTQSMWKIIFTQFLDHRMAVVGAIIIHLLIIVAIGADFISKWTGLDPNEQNVSARYLQPFERAEISADQRESQIEKWIQEHNDQADKIQKTLIEKQIVTVAEKDAIFELAAKPMAEAITTLQSLQIPESKNLEQVFNHFSTLHIFGTDEIGRDVFIRLIYGARVSLGVGVLVAIASALFGFLIGSFAGYYGGYIDMALMRVTDALLSLPMVPVLIVIAAIDLQKIPWLKEIIGGSYESILKMILILCLFSWMPVARLVRGSILSLREREFILAAHTLGASDSTIIFRHLFPNVIAPMLVSITLGVGQSILFEAALSYLGLGIMPPTASWGNMLNNAQEVIYKNMWLTILPGIFILLTTISFNFFGDGLQDAMDPKSIRR